MKLVNMPQFNVSEIEMGTPMKIKVKPSLCNGSELRLINCKSNDYGLVISITPLKIVLLTASGCNSVITVENISSGKVELIELVAKEEN